MFQISGDAIAGIVVGFVLGLIVYRWLIYEIVEEEEAKNQHSFRYERCAECKEK